MNKKRIVTGVGVVLLITGIVGSIWSGIEVMPKLINDAQAMQNNLNQQEVLYKGKIDLAKLNINSKVSNIIIKKYDGKDVIVERSGNKNLSTITTKESGSELTIDEEFNNNNSNLGKSIDDIVRYLVDELYTSHNSDITVYIPENIDINVNTNNGGLYINGVNANNLNFNTQYGNISLSENSNIKTLNIKSNSDISLKVREVYCIDNLSIEEQDEEDEDRKLWGRRSNKVVNMPQTQQVKMVICQPTTFEQSESICNLLKEKKSIIVNLEYVNKDVARRIVDFISGGVYALDGYIQKVSNSIFLVAPSNYEITNEMAREEMKSKLSVSWLKNNNVNN